MTMMQSQFLETMSWQDAAVALRDFKVLLIPLGAESKQHGPHLPLNNDYLMAKYLSQIVMKEVSVLVGPTIGLHYYPAFTDYAGSISLSFDTATQIVVEYCQSLSQFGMSHFYVLNTGVSTGRPLIKAQTILEAKNINLQFTNILTIARDTERQLESQAGGTHADELETSMMLYLDADIVNMALAVEDFHPGTGKFSPTRQANTIYSPSGIYGNPTLATKEKGKLIVDAMCTAIVKEIQQMG